MSLCQRPSSPWPVVALVATLNVLNPGALVEHNGLT